MTDKQSLTDVVFEHFLAHKDVVDTHMLYRNSYREIEGGVPQKIFAQRVYILPKNLIIPTDIKPWEELVTRMNIFTYGLIPEILDIKDPEKKKKVRIEPSKIVDFEIHQDDMTQMGYLKFRENLGVYAGPRMMLTNLTTKHFDPTVNADDSSSMPIISEVVLYPIPTRKVYDEIISSRDHWRNHMNILERR